MAGASPDQLELLGKVMQRGGKSLWLSHLWGACAFCATAGSGFLAGHAGCLITPLVTAALPSLVSVWGVNPYEHAATLGASAAVEAAALGVWWYLHGRKAPVSVPMRVTTIGFAVVAFAVTAFLRFQHMEAAMEAEMAQAFELARQTLDRDPAEVAKELHMPLRELLKIYGPGCSGSSTPAPK